MLGQGTKMVFLQKDFQLSLLQRLLDTGWFGAESCQDPTLQGPMPGCALEQQEGQRDEGRLHPAENATFFVPVLPKNESSSRSPLNTQ